MPETVFLFHVRNTVTPFIPKPTVCRKCLRFGPVAKISKSSTTLCMKCSEVTHNFDDKCNCLQCQKECVAKCNYCKINGHNVFQNFCDEMTKQTNIKKIMILQKLSFMEAKQEVEKKNKQPDNCTYASITSLTNQLDELRVEIEKLNKQNLNIIQRSHSAETILKDFTTNISEKEHFYSFSENELKTFNSKIISAFSKHKEIFMDLAITNSKKNLICMISVIFNQYFLFWFSKSTQVIAMTTELDDGDWCEIVADHLFNS